MADNPQVIAEGLSFPEGPRWHEGQLWFVDHLDGKVFRVPPGAAPDEFARLPHGASGMGWLPDGTQLVVSMHDQRILRLEADGVVEHASLAAIATGPLNDMIVTSEGRAFVGSFGSDLGGGEPLRESSLFRIEPDGRAAVVADGLVFPNGMALSEDGRTLIVAESYALRLTAFDVDDAGDLSNRRIWAEFGPDPGLDAVAAIESGATIPDGIALDAEGAVWVSNPIGHEVLRVSEGGRVLNRVDVGQWGSYAVALGGPLGRTLFVCTNTPLGRIRPGTDRDGRVLAFSVAIPGAGSL